MKEFFDAIGKAARSIIAFGVTIMSFGFLYFLLFKKIPAENKDVVQITSGIVLGVLATVVSYYFGSSKDKSDSEKADRVIETAQQLQADKTANKE
jgi:hypothetical protein